MIEKLFKNVKDKKKFYRYIRREIIILCCQIITPIIIFLFFWGRPLIDFQNPNREFMKYDMNKSIKIKNETNKKPSEKTISVPVQKPKPEKYMPTDSDIRRYMNAWNMFMNREYLSRYKDGYYTDSNLVTPVRDFWSNGIYAKFDSDEDGSHEIIFKVRDKKLVYVGILGEYNIFTATADNYRELTGKSLDDFIKEYAKSEQKRETKIIERKDGRKEYHWKDENGVPHSIVLDN